MVKIVQVRKKKKLEKEKELSLSFFSVLESSSTSSPQQSTTTTTTSNNNNSGMWVVGLQFKNINKVQLDLTEEIRIFLSVVYKASSNSNMNRENINLDAR